MRISVFLNSRDRIHQLERLMYSVLKKAKNPKDIELIIRIDNDDLESRVFLDREQIFYDNYQVYYGDRPTNLHQTINWMAEQASGDFLFVMNDDAHILNNHWDESLKDIDPNEIWYLRTDDDSADKNMPEYASFPILTRAAYKALGYFMSEQFVGLGGDVHLFRIFSTLGLIKDVNIQINHDFHDTVEKVMRPDETAVEMRQNSWKHHVDPWHVNIDEDVRRIKSWIE